MTRSNRFKQGSRGLQPSLRPHACHEISEGTSNYTSNNISNNTSNYNTHHGSDQARQTRRRRPADCRAPGRKGHGLASTRDRERLRENHRAERARVEKMLATAPLSGDRRNSCRVSLDRYEEPTRSAVVPLGGPIGLGSQHMACCPICGDDRIVTDEVIHAGTLSMSECLHCDHRWTRRLGARWIDLGARMNRGRGVRAAATA
jgi:hypothetical protein